MKRFTAYLIPAAAVLAALLSLSCEQQIDYVDATWARPVSPAEGSTLKIDFFKPDDKQVFTWEPPTRSPSTWTCTSRTPASTTWGKRIRSC